MSDTRPVALPVPQDPVPTNRREKFVARWKKVQIASRKLAVYSSSHKAARMVMLQTAGAAMALVGIALLFSAPVALVVGGIGAIVVAERQ